MKKRRGRNEGAIRQRPDGRWEARASFGYDLAGRRIRKSVYGATKSEVAQKLARLMAAGPPSRGPRSPLASEFLQTYLDHVRQQHSVATWNLRNTAIKKHIVPTLGPLRLSVITPQHVAALLQSLHQRGVGKRMVQVVHATLRASLSYAQRLELVEKNACATIPKPRANAQPQRILSIEEAQRLLSTALAQDRDYALYCLALTTGMRQGEILALHWDRVDLGGRRIRVEQTLTEDLDGDLKATPPKTSSSRRTIDLPNVTVEALQTLRAQQQQSGYTGAWVFPDHNGGPRRKSNLIRRSLKPLLRAAGLCDVTFHSLRHVANSVLLAQGESVKVAAERLGHSTTRMTLDVYSHVLPTTQRSAADRLDAIFRISPQRAARRSNTSTDREATSE
jgi:integrase